MFKFQCTENPRQRRFASLCAKRSGTAASNARSVQLARSGQDRETPLGDPHQAGFFARLASFHIFQLTADGAVAHTPRSRLLRTDTPNSMHHAARFWTGPGSWNAWGKLDVAMTGGIPHEAAWNMDRFTYLRQHPDEARIFDAMMANFPDNRHAAIAAAYDFRMRSLSPTSGVATAQHFDISSLVSPHRAELYLTVRT